MSITKKLKSMRMPQYSWEDIVSECEYLDEKFKQQELLIRYMKNELVYQKGSMQDLKEWYLFDRLCDVLDRVKRKRREFNEL
jgi:hypothetical protein